MHLTPFDQNTNNLYGLYHKILNHFNKQGKTGCIYYPEESTIPWPSFSFSDDWTIESIAEELAELKKIILKDKISPYLIIPGEIINNYSQAFTINNFIPVTLWFSMNFKNQETFGVYNEIDTLTKVDNIEAFTHIINTCHFSSQPFHVNDIESMMKLEGIELFLFQNKGAYTSGCFCHTNNINTGIYMVSTLPEHQKKGHAKKMLQLIAQLKKNPLILQATIESRPLYEKIGFETVGELIIYCLKR
ncbi:MAG: GNAT family N-acetyltransferase [Marinilabiliaceae bacterium]|nr:GNAT family N-acetyltransferase [Marinilabiliaceae bacterium]